MPSAPWDLAQRAWRDGEAFAFLDGTPDAATTPAEREVRQTSLVAARPAASLCVRAGRAWRRDGEGPWRAVEGEPWALVRAFLPRGAARVPVVVALLSYDAARLLERLPSRAVDELALPDILLHRFDAAWWVPAGGEPCLEGAPDATLALAERAKGEPTWRSGGRTGEVRAEMARGRFEALVARAQEHVRAGDVFQVNLSHRLAAECSEHPLALYARLRDANPAPFGALFASGPLPEGAPFAVLSSSPERLFRLERGRLEARPIAGTRRRGATREEDAALADELSRDAKERAEHVMMVDLARNDIGRVARYGSVRVPRLLAVESYRTVHHLVSTVEAQLAEGADVVDAIRALFPGATITGAPKVRSMEVIEELEPVRRGVYTGSLGWIAGGDADLNILIRTMLLREGTLHLQAGAGIVEESDPAREWDETLAKARGMRLAVEARP